MPLPNQALQTDALRALLNATPLDSQEERVC